ncbi:hypothetical protein Lepto7375DRAFT_7131 [Leptolyngbya sp. PCC 7375]|nr:hypothetical protein Lepto7375DRAFT_7131 [Leptolyngbya sp. PCC 7375]
MQYDGLRSEEVFNEVAIAQCNGFQIAIPSKTQIVPRKIFSTWVPLAKRVYHSKGGIIWDRQLSFSLSELRIQNLFKRSSIFPELNRLAVGIPISFEIQSTKPLPKAICKQATLTCRMPGKENIYYSIFREITPKFVKISPCQNIVHLNDQIGFASMLGEGE